MKRWVVLSATLVLVTGPVACRRSTSAGTAASMPAAPPEQVAFDAKPPVDARFVDVPGVIEAPICSRVMIAVAEGRVVAMGEALVAGDVVVVTHPDPIALGGTGVVLGVREDFGPDRCAVKARPALAKTVVRASEAAELRWAAGAMSARLDVGATVSPDAYLGRLEGTSAVAAHSHAASWEILAAVDAHGTFVLDGVTARLGPKQIVIVPPGKTHAWTPDPGSRLVAIQMYSPPGPEQRFVALAAAAAKDAGAADPR